MAGDEGGGGVVVRPRCREAVGGGRHTLSGRA